MTYTNEPAARAGKPQAPWRRGCSRAWPHAPSSLERLRPGMCTPKQTSHGLRRRGKLRTCHRRPVRWPRTHSDFTSLVQAVKPAVVSVRVKAPMDQQMVNFPNGAPNGNPFRGTPFEKFQPTRQFGEKTCRSRRSRSNGQQPKFNQGQGWASSFPMTVSSRHQQPRRRQGGRGGNRARGWHAVACQRRWHRQQDGSCLVEGLGPQRLPLCADGRRDACDRLVGCCHGQSVRLGAARSTAGIVSAHGRDIGSGPYDDFIQIDAAVNHGNSGGPTFNLQGKKVVVNTAIFSPTGGSVGIAFDIPAANRENRRGPAA